MCLQVSGGGQGGKTGAAEGREAPYSIIGTRVSRFAADAPLSLSPPCFGTHVSLYYYTCGTHVSLYCYTCDSCVLMLLEYDGR